MERRKKKHLFVYACVNTHTHHSWATDVIAILAENNATNRKKKKNRREWGITHLGVSHLNWKLKTKLAVSNLHYLFAHFPQCWAWGPGPIDSCQVLCHRATTPGPSSRHCHVWYGLILPHNEAFLGSPFRLPLNVYLDMDRGVMSSVLRSPTNKVTLAPFSPHRWTFGHICGSHKPLWSWGLGQDSSSLSLSDLILSPLAQSLTTAATLGGVSHARRFRRLLPPFWGSPSQADLQGPDLHGSQRSSPSERVLMFALLFSLITGGSFLPGRLLIVL